MTYVDRLNDALKAQLRMPWNMDQSGGERVWFLVFDPDKLRQVMARKAVFQLAVEDAGRRWVEIDLSHAFGEWMGSHRYAERFFSRPSRAKAIPNDFAHYLVADIQQRIDDLQVDENTLLVLVGTEALFGINKLSHLTRLIEDIVPGRLLVFFPGEYNEPHYRFLDARDGWNYLAIPITSADGR